MEAAVSLRELDEVTAPADVPADGAFPGVTAGARGVVLLVFDRPLPAVEVEFVLGEEEPYPCVIYSPDLSEVYDTHPGYGA